MHRKPNYKNRVQMLILQFKKISLKCHMHIDTRFNGLNLYNAQSVRPCETFVLLLYRYETLSSHKNFSKKRICSNFVHQLQYIYST